MGITSRREIDHEGLGYRWGIIFIAPHTSVYDYYNYASDSVCCGGGTPVFASHGVVLPVDCCRAGRMRPPPLVLEWTMFLTTIGTKVLNSWSYLAACARVPDCVITCQAFL